MIDFRYHIVSITAVFLAIGIGVAVGATVLDRATVAQLENRVDDLSARLDQRRKEVSELESDVSRKDEMVNSLSAHVSAGVLAGREVIFVDQSHGADWVVDMRRKITESGARSIGSIEFTPEWGRRAAPGDLADRFESAGLDVPETQTVESFIRTLGQHVGDVVGQGLLRELSDAGYVRSDLEDEGIFSGPGAVIVFTGGAPDRPEAKRVAAFAEGAASSGPTTVVAGSTEELGGVGALRDAEASAPELTTFDAAAEDETGVAAVLALRAAVDGRGGDYGSGRGLSYLPPA